MIAFYDAVAIFTQYAVNYACCMYKRCLFCCCFCFVFFKIWETFDGTEAVWKCAKVLLKIDDIMHEICMFLVQN